MKSKSENNSKLLKLILLILNNTQFLVTFLTLISILYLHSIHSIYFSIGTLISTFSAKLLKKCIRQPRPLGATKYTKTYGMPSTHSSSISFFGTYLSLSTLLLPIHPRIESLLPFYWKDFLKNTLTSHSIMLEIIFRILIASLWIISSILVCWSRIKLGHHTFKQVLIGALLGSLVAIIWLIIWIGLNDLFKLLHLPKFWEGIIFVDNSSRRDEGIEGILLGGIKEIGKVWEIKVEDTVWIFLDTWKENKWEALKGLKSFPLLIIGGVKDEL